MIDPPMEGVWIEPVSHFDLEQDSLSWANRVTEGRRRNRGIVTARMDGSFAPLTVAAYADQAAKTDRGVEPSPRNSAMSFGISPLSRDGAV